MITEATELVVDRWDPTMGWRHFRCVRQPGTVMFEAVEEVEPDGLTPITGHNWSTCGMGGRKA